MVQGAWVSLIDMKAGIRNKKLLVDFKSNQFERDGIHDDGEIGRA